MDIDKLLDNLILQQLSDPFVRHTNIKIGLNFIIKLLDGALNNLPQNNMLINKSILEMTLIKYINKFKQNDAYVYPNVRKILKDTYFTMSIHDTVLSLLKNDSEALNTLKWDKLQIIHNPGIDNLNKDVWYQTAFKNKIFH